MSRERYLKLCLKPWLRHVMDLYLRPKMWRRCSTTLDGDGSGTSFKLCQLQLAIRWGARNHASARSAQKSDDMDELARSEESL